MNQRVALSDIQGVRVRCRTCDVAVTYPLAELRNVGASDCPHCAATGRGPAIRSTTATDRLRQLGPLLWLLLADERAEVSLEVVTPPPKSPG